MKNLNEVYENKYISNEAYKAQDERDFEFQFSVSVYGEDAGVENGILITVDAAKLPKYLTMEQRKSVMKSAGVKFKELSVNDIADYGISATFEWFKVANETELEAKLQEIDEKIPVYGMLCGFYFDKPQNRIGNTGWDFINGQIGFKK